MSLQTSDLLSWNEGGILEDQVKSEKWQEFCREEIISSILKSVHSGNTAELHSHVCNVIKDVIEDNMECHRKMVMLGVTCLKLFVQQNWTGPPVDLEGCEPLSTLMNTEELNSAATAYYESKTDDLYPLLSYPILLLIADIILVQLHEILDLYKPSTLWGVKLMATFLHVVNEVKEVHSATFQRLYEKGTSILKSTETFSREIKAQFYMESSHLFLKIYNYNMAQDCSDEASGLLGIKVSLTSSLGKRTKFQQKDLPQMKLNVTLHEKRESTKTLGEPTRHVPTNVALDNDTLLPEVKFIDADSAKLADVSAVDQAFIISNCVQLRKSKPRDDLSYEELLPYAESVLRSPQSWSVQYKALMLRCTTEFSNSRKAERALQQLEELTKSFNNPIPNADERYLLAHSIDLQPKWEHERTYAQLLFSIGCTDSALEIFLRLCIWDDVIACYQRLGKHGKAEAVIRKQLEMKETTTLWCLLGDATLDKQYYEKAWQFSNERSARAQKSLGFWHLRRKDFHASIPYFEKSLELNCLQPDTAFSLGCACMASKELEKASRAFQKAVGLEPDSFEGWNNLASCFIRLNDLSKAYKALQNATRLSFNNWKIWENFCLVCTDLGAFEDSIHCVHRLIDLQRKEIDVAVLQILVDVTIKDQEDVYGRPASRLKPRVQKMLGHVTSSITNNSRIWEIYAQLCLSNKTKDEDEKALQFLYKSHRCYTQNTEWEKTENEIPNLMRVTLKMIEVTNLVCSNVEVAPRKLALWATTKMNIANSILRLKKAFVDTENNPLPSVVEPIRKLEEHLSQVQTSIQELE